MMGDAVEITTDKGKIDLGFVHQFLSKEAYWSKDRSMDEVKRSIAHSLCFSMFDATKGNQIGFARVATDYVVFAWVMDFFISKGYRGKGYAKNLMDYILNYPKLAEVNGFGLRTNDAHGLYKQFGFTTISDPDTWMFKKNTK